MERGCVNSSMELFQQMAKWECERNIAEDKYVPCGKPATHVIEWRHQDGDCERRILCRSHAIAEARYSHAMDYNASVHVSDIEKWKITVVSAGRVAWRIGRAYYAALGEDLTDVSTFSRFPARSFSKGARPTAIKTHVGLRFNRRLPVGPSQYFASKCRSIQR